MKPTKEQSQRIQVLRGLAIIAVVFIHNTSGGLYQVLCRPFLNFSVGLFLFLSGMLSNRDHWHVVKRLWKILIPYVVWTLVYSLLNNPHSLSALPSAFFYNLITSKAAAMLYYVFVYCELTLLIPVVDKFARSKYWFAGFMISPFEVVVMRTLPLAMGIEINPIIRNVMAISCIGWFSYFYFGYLVGNGMIHVNIRTSSLIIIGGVQPCCNYLRDTGSIRWETRTAALN